MEYTAGLCYICRCVVFCPVQRWFMCISIIQWLKKYLHLWTVFLTTTFFIFVSCCIKCWICFLANDQTILTSLCYCYQCNSICIFLFKRYNWFCLCVCDCVCVCVFPWYCIYIQTVYTSIHPTGSAHVISLQVHETEEAAVDWCLSARRTIASWHSFPSDVTHHLCLSII